MGGTLIGLKDLHYSKLLKDDPAEVTYEAVKKILGAIAAKIKPKSSSETLYADDGAADTVAALGEVEIELEAKDVPLSVQADLLGHTLKDGVLIKNASDVAPYVAIGFKSLKSNGKYRYVWLLKGRFELIEEDYETKGDKVKFQTPKLKASFIKVESTGDWQYTGDEDETGFTQQKAAAWFTKVYNPNATAA